VEEE
jgi:hypothetical protein